MTALPHSAWCRVIPSASPEPRLQDRWQRLWLEARRNRGDDALAAARAVADSTLRTALFALDRQADALALPGDAVGNAAWHLLQPRSTRPCADVFWADLQGEFGCMVWPGTDPAAAADTVLTAASVTGAQAVWVNFRASESRVPSSWVRACALLAARLPLLTLDLYSPLYFDNGRLLAAPLLQKLRTHCGPALTLLLLIPSLEPNELASAIRTASGSWAGPFRLGAQIPAARLDSSCRPSDVRLTLDFLARLARS